MNFGSALASDVQNFTPGHAVWYWRLLANRFLFDNLRRQLDPDYPRLVLNAPSRTPNWPSAGESVRRKECLIWAASVQ